MTRVNTTAITLWLIGAMPMAASAQAPEFVPHHGDRAFSMSGTGSGDRNFDSGSFSVTGELGWYLRNHLITGARKSINYASIEGEGITDGLWNGSTRGALNYHFLDNRARPFVGGSLGGIHGDRTEDITFAGLEAGLKYYVQTKTYFLAGVEYQFLISSSDLTADAFQDDGAWVYKVGLGYNF